MPRNLNDIINHLSPALRKKVEARAGDRGRTIWCNSAAFGRTTRPSWSPLTLSGLS